MVIKQKNKGFTLIEIILISVVVVIIAAAVIVAINPARRINESNDSRRWSDVRSLSMAIGAYVADNGGDVPNCGTADIPSDGIYRCIGQGGGSAHNYTADVISWWSLDEDSDPRVDPKNANDLSVSVSFGNNENDKVQGAASGSSNATGYLYKNEPFNGDFPGENGIDDYNMTVTAWVKLSELGNHAIAAKTNSNDDIDNSWLFGVKLDGNKERPLVLLRNRDDRINFIDEKTNLTIGQWHHLAFSFERNGVAPNYYHTVKIYVDGFPTLVKNDESFAGVNFPPGSIVPFNVGYGQTPRGGSSQTYYLDGLLDELAVFNKVLTPEEIQEIYFYGLDGSRPCCDLSGDLGQYLTPMPTDPQQGDQDNAGYIIKRTSDSKIYIRAPFQSEETSDIIQVSR